MKLVPKRRFKGFSGEWKERGLGHITESFSGGTPPVGNSEYYGGDIPFIRSGEIHAKRTKLHISKEGLNNSAAKTVQVGDILYALYGATSGEVSISKINGAINQAILAIRAIDNDDHYLIAELLKVQKDKIINTYLQGGQGNLSGTIVKQLLIRLPIDKTEQGRISSFLQKYDAIVNLQLGKLEKLQAMKQAYLHEMFPAEGESVPKRRFEGFTGEWEETQLGDIAEIVGGGTPSTSNPSYWNGNIDWYSPTEIGKQVFANGSIKTITQLGLEKSSANLLPAKRTILFTSRASIGDMAILLRPGTTNQGFQSLVLRDGVDTYFIYSMGHLLKTEALKNASGSTFLEISGNNLGKIMVLFPLIEEQQKIGSFFRKLDKRIARQEEKVEKLKAMKQAYLHEMFV